MDNKNKICPNCNGTQIKQGKLLKHAQIINEEKRPNALKSSSFCSPLILDVCTNCSKVIDITVENISIFK